MNSVLFHCRSFSQWQILRKNWASFPTETIQKLFDEAKAKHKAQTLSQETNTVAAIQRRLTSRAESVLLQRSESLEAGKKREPNIKDDAVAAVVALGFPADMALRALEASNMVVDDAVVALLDGKFSSGDDKADQGSNQ